MFPNNDYATTKKECIAKFPARTFSAQPVFAEKSTALSWVVGVVIFIVVLVGGYAASACVQVHCMKREVANEREDQVRKDANAAAKARKFTTAAIKARKAARDEAEFKEAASDEAEFNEAASDEVEFKEAASDEAEFKEAASDDYIV
eukprot:991698_1